MQAGTRTTTRNDATLTSGDEGEAMPDVDRESVARPRPDWRDAESYAYTRDLTPEGWAWEFLRRNPEYRAECAAHVSKCGEQAADPDAELWGLVGFSDPRC